MNKHNQAETDFFIVALKEEARTAIWQVGSSTDPDTLIESVIEEIEALAPRPDGQEDRSDEEIRRQIGECLVKAAYATRPYCIRCGTCCTKGSPTLSINDLELFTRDIVRPSDVLTIRKGELARAAGSDELERTEKELVKIREVPGNNPAFSLDPGTKNAQSTNRGRSNAAARNVGTLRIRMRSAMRRCWPGKRSCEKPDLCGISSNATKNDAHTIG